MAPFQYNDLRYSDGDGDFGAVGTEDEAAGRVREGMGRWGWHAKGGSGQDIKLRFRFTMFLLRLNHK